MKTNALIFFSLINNVMSYERLEGIDFYGGDMYPIYNVNESVKCMNLCEQIRNCRLVSHCDNICYIKNLKTNQTSKDGCVSYDMYPLDNGNIESLEGSGSKYNEINNSSIIVETKEPADTIVTGMPVIVTETPVPTTIQPISSSNKSSIGYSYSCLVLQSFIAITAISAYLI
jgi:hypothetical protein